MKEISEFPPAEEMPWATAVKAFIVNGNGEILVLKRNKNRPHSPGAYDIPGGRLENGEDPVSGVKRETLEETGLEIEVGPVLAVNSFVRDDLQKITMLIFLCRPKSPGKISLEKNVIDSFEWVGVEDAREILAKFSGVVGNYLEYFRGKF